MLFSIGDFIRIIRERWIWGFLVALLVAATFAYFMMRREPVYRAVATVLVESHPDRVVDIERVVDQSINPFRMQIELNNHLEQMRSQAFLTRVLESLTDEQMAQLVAPYAEEGPWYNAGYIINEHFSVDLVYDTQVFKLTFDHRDPEMAALMSNRIAHEYTSFLGARSGMGNQRALDFLQEQATLMRLKLEEAEKHLHEYRQNHNLVSLEDNQAIMSQRLKEISASLTRSELELNHVRAKISQIEETESEEGRLSLPFIAASEGVDSLIAQLSEAQRERQVLSQTYLARHPIMLENASLVASLERKVGERIVLMERELRSLENELVRQRANLMEEFNLAEKQALALEEAAIQYNVLTRNRETAKKMYTQILDRLHEASIAAELKDTNLRLVDTAGTPGEPYLPNKKHVAAVSAFLFGLCFITVPLGLNVMNRQLRKTDEVSEYLGQELIGVVPKATRAQRRVLIDPTAQQPRCSISESFRAIYSALKIQSNGSLRSLMITSTLPSEGKSLVAAHIATSFSRHDKRTLLIDCDLRRPCQHNFFNLSNDCGLIRWFESGKPIPRDEEIFTDPELGIEQPHPRLFVCRAGGVTDSPTEMLQHHRIIELLRHFKEHFDVIIVDTAPAGLFPEAFLLAAELDRALYVVEHNKVARARVRRIIQRLGRTGATLSGVIFNKVKGRHEDLLNDHNYGYNLHAGGKDYARYYRHYQGRRVG